LHMAQLMPLPLTVSCFSKIQIGFTFLVPADLGRPEKGPLNGCVCFTGRMLFLMPNQSVKALKATIRTERGRDVVIGIVEVL